MIQNLAHHRRKCSIISFRPWNQSLEKATRRDVSVTLI